MQSPSAGTPDADPDAMPRLAIEVLSDEQEVRLIMTGELDIATAHALDRVIDETVSDGQPQVIIDLAGLTFMDSIGLAAVVRARRGAAGSHHRLAVQGGSLQVRRLLAVTGMLELLSNEQETSVTEE